MTRPVCLLAVFAATAIPAVAQQPASGAGEDLDQTRTSRVIVPWRHFGPQAGGPSATSNSAQNLVLRPVSFNPAAAQPADAGTAADAPPASSMDALTAVSNLSADYQKREQDRQERLREFEAASHNDPSNPTSQALADIETTRLLLEGEQDRMQSSEQLSHAFRELATKLDTHTSQLKALLKARKEMAQQSDAEIARINAETPDISLALKNLALLPAGAENDQFMQRLAARLDHLDQVLKTDQTQDQQAHRQIADLEAEEREMGQASYQARAKAAELTTASQQAKVNQDLLANRLEFSTARQRALDEISSASQALAALGTLHEEPAVQQAALGGVQQQPAATPGVDAAQVDALRACIRRTGDVAACRASGGEQK
ncbi:MAG TPA: hypothetical protein VMT20_24710 [Terriglobia bacterium]|nr:hypothetical protein [Terriglobia bacterium]